MRSKLGPPGLIIIGSSTGGPDALRTVLANINLAAAVIVVQHMPAFINESLRQTIERISGMPCILPESMERINSGTIYLAPSDVHLKLQGNRVVHLEPGPNVNYVCPAADVTMQSLKKDVHHMRLAGVVLTGMGKDGANGISHIKSLGGLTIAQAPKTCSVDAMPTYAIETGNVDHVLKLDQIRLKLINEFSAST